MKKSVKKPKNSCPLCATKIPHLVVTLSKGDVHVHAPFKNAKMMTLFQDSIESEYDAWCEENE